MELDTLFWGIRKPGIFSRAGLITGGHTLSSFNAIVYGRMIEALIAARKAANVTQAELGRRIGQRQTFVSKFELGERRLDAAEFIKVGRAIGADPFVIMQDAEAS
ncbi:MAG: helix-turn-helix domain-containing protein [Pseudorhizobium sp.]